tara:strand:- start:2380 stop:3333 length:954 start_codon:yes stop_codon:yes gene_type:complete
MKLRLFYNSAVIATILSYLLIFIGGLVRVSGAGMGCPNWPKCAEGWIPPTNIDINQINTTLAWIEFTNRMFGVILGISIIVLNVIAIFYFRKKYNSFSTNQASLLFYSILSLIFVVINGILGGVLVRFELNPYIKTAHMLFALVLVSILSYICIKSYKILNPKLFKGLKNNSNLSKSLIFLWILIVIEILLGTGIRTNIELNSPDFFKENPLGSIGDLLDTLPSYKYLHSILGFLLLFLSIYIYLQFRNHKLYIVQFLRMFIIAMIIVQIFLGYMLVLFDLPQSFQQLTRLFHTWGSSWLVGVIIILYNCISDEYAK